MTDAALELAVRARGLAPLLAEHAAEAERLRRPHDAVIAALEEAGIFRLMVPRCYGGLELDLDAFLEVGLALAEGDASMAWVSTFYIEHNWMLCQFPEAFQRELYADRSHVLAPAMVTPSGVAERAPGGFRLNGRWKWATGSMHGTWVIVSGRVEPAGDGGLDFRFWALPREDVTVEDTWHVDGMCGTGSHDVVIESRIVPEERSVSVLAMSAGHAPGAKLHEGPLYRTPMLPILGLAASMPAVGQARAVLRGFRERLGGHVRLGSATSQAEKPAAQMRLARAEIEVRQAEGLLRGVVVDVMAKRETATPANRTRWLASLAYAVDQSKRVIGSVAEVSGGSAHFLDNALQRSKRDVDTLSCHAVLDLDARLESHGRTLLGLDPGGMF
jgi:alkylation response protein AidB-like acyl-CoA dehydrogenase